MAAPGRVVARVGAHWLAQLRSMTPAVPLVLLLTLAVLLAAGVQTRVPVLWLVRDPAQTAQFPFYLGLLSNLGILCWAACAAICLFSARVVSREASSFLLFAGLVTAVLGLDDLFLFHEEVFPVLLNVPEHVVLGAYAAMLLALLVRYWKLILRTDYLVLGLALAFSGASTIVDTGLFNQGLNYLLDDGLKLLGIVTWLTYFARTCAQQVRLEMNA